MKQEKDTWIVRRFYDHHLIKTAKNGRKVDKMKLTVALVEGNTDIPRLAQQGSNGFDTKSQSAEFQFSVPVSGDMIHRLACMDSTLYP